MSAVGRAAWSPRGPGGKAPVRAVEGLEASAEGAPLRTLRWDAPGAVGRVLVVHGLGEHAGRHAGLARTLASRGYSVLAYDQRGHGLSAGRRGYADGLDGFLDDLERMHELAAKALRGPGDPFLLGHSMGGLILVRYLQTRHPEAPGAVLSAPWLATAHPLPLWKRALASVLGRVAPGFTLSEPLGAGALTRDPDEIRAYEEDTLVHSRVSAGLFTGARRAQARARAAALDPSVPTLVLVPGDDPLADASATLAWGRDVAGPGVEVVELPGGRHEPFHDLGRDDVMERVVDWLDTRRRDASGGEPPGPGRVSLPPSGPPGP